MKPLCLLATLAVAACATGGTGSPAGGEVFTDWEMLWQHYAPNAQTDRQCIRSLGRGETTLRGPRPVPVVEVEGRRFFDGCVPPYVFPESVAGVDILNASEASIQLGSRGAGGMVRLTLRDGA